MKLCAELICIMLFTVVLCGKGCICLCSTLHSGALNETLGNFRNANK